MTITRDNHYVPCWYQKRFLEPGRATLAYLDLEPPTRVLNDGRVIRERSLFDASPKRCFFQTDLYSTFFGTAVSDHIERRLFGDIDTRGADAVRAIEATDPTIWHEHFGTFFEYLDIQKLRTPKGLAWLRGQYPLLDQNELMREMLGIRMLHTTIWTECVREIVSAENSDVKFLVTDHPVTIYNHARPPTASQCGYPNDPGIALKASQTVFPLSRNYCLILTNLEYAKNPSANPIEKRTFARNFRPSIARTDKFIRTRRLTDLEVSTINLVLKTRARRYIAAGRYEWLHPEKFVTGSWVDLASTLLPPNDQLWGFDSEVFIGHTDGSVHYQDAFGRSYKQSDALKKVIPDRDLAPNDPCGCGSGQPYRLCCHTRSAALRPIWAELSIRERNLIFFDGLMSILQMDQGKDWATVRRELTDEQIREAYLLHELLWPLETDLLALLPKPDGRPRAVYTGSLHPESIVEFALGASPYFGELLLENPFVHAGTVSEKFRPTKHPRIYHQEFLKSVVFFLRVIPMVDAGLINLVPNPCTFDHHLREQTILMAQERAPAIAITMRDDPSLQKLFRLEQMRDLLMFPKSAQEARLRKNFSDLDKVGLAQMLAVIDRMKEDDPLAALQDGILGGGEDGGQMRIMQMSPNFEIAMYLAQATGASIVTDSAFRWQEILHASRARAAAPPTILRRLASDINNAMFFIPKDTGKIVELARDKVLDAYPKLFAEIFRYLGSIAPGSPKPNYEDGLAARFLRIHASTQLALKRRGESGNVGRFTCVLGPNGIQDNAINRLLLMSSSEHHLPNVPMAFYFQRPESKH